MVYLVYVVNACNQLHCFSVQWHCAKLLSFSLTKLKISSNNVSRCLKRYQKLRRGSYIQRRIYRSYSTLLRTLLKNTIPYRDIKSCLFVDLMVDTFSRHQKLPFSRPFGQNDGFSQLNFNGSFLKFVVMWVSDCSLKSHALCELWYISWNILFSKYNRGIKRCTYTHNLLGITIGQVVRITTHFLTLLSLCV